jgi:adenosylcobinamide-GDP ribazoletransferase
MPREYQSLLSAVQYFTRLPVPAWVGHDAAQLEGSIRYFPLVGLLIGVAGVGVFVLAHWVLPQAIAVVLTIAAVVLLTGALHEDGLADTFDGLGSMADRTRALQIMKDPRIGTFGALALALVLLLRFLCLDALAPTLLVVAFIAAQSLSRLCALLVMWRLDYARDDESTRARPMVKGLNTRDIAVAAVFGLVPLVACGWRGLCALLATLLLTGLLRGWFKARLGGYTGDSLGAVQQLNEVVFYLVMVGTWKSF